MADGIGAAQAAAELAQAAGRNASAYANGGDGDSDGPDLDAVNETLNGVFDMPGIVPGPSWSSRARRRGRGAATAAARPTPPPRRGQQRQRRGTAAKGNGNRGATSPGEPQPGPSRGRGRRRQIANRQDLNASSTDDDDADRGEIGDTKTTESPKDEVEQKDTVKEEDNVKEEGDKVKDDPDSIDIDNVQETVEIGSSNSNSCDLLDEEETDSDDDDDSEYHDSYDLSYDLERDDDGYRGRGNTGVRAEAAARNAEAAARRAMMDDKIKKKMENMFKTSLDLADDEGYMEACEGVTTRLYPHQMRALYWMTQRENKFDGRDGVTGGILADDMGLGKTLSVLSLIMTNFHDERPLGRPVAGYSRAKNRTGSFIRYMPVALLGSTPRGAGSKNATTKRGGGAKKGVSTATVQAKLNARKGLNLFGFGRKKDLNGKVKSSAGAVGRTVKASKPINFGNESEDDSSDEEEDEFDSMCNEKSGSFSERLGMSGRERSELFAKPERRFFDGLSDDEEYMAMSEKERNEAAKRALKDDDDEDFNVVNLDGAVESPDEDESAEDEFDAMCNEKSASLSERLGLTPSPNKSGLFATHREEHTNVSNGAASKSVAESEDDDENQPLSKKIKRKVARVESSDEEDEQPKSFHNKGKRKVAKVETSSDEEDEQPNSSPEKRVKLLRRVSSLEGEESSDGFPELPDLPDLNDEEQEEDAEKSKTSAPPKPRAAPELSDEQKAKLVSNKREPPKLDGRRKTTLIVTPASLISHWLQQIDQHVDDRVEIKVGVHHGTCRELTARELETYDIVLTTYGTMMAELAKLEGGVDGPLIRARWLRVVLDEGHYIKNHLSRTHKAAAQLDTRRKWIISGTPIQNNLKELWSLLKWMEYEPYASHRPLFRDQIEQPVKIGDPCGVARLQTIVKSIALRRTKNDQVNGKPLVSLPSKTITVTELEFTREERAVYDAWMDQGREIILKYIRRGTLMRNYAHVFAIMVRLRQLSCHRELLDHVDWRDVDMDDLLRTAQRHVTDQDEAPKEGEGDEDRRKALAEQLRELIKSGASDECSICLSEFRSPVITMCAHVYCRQCITQHIQAAARQAAGAACPLCRAVVEDSPACLLEAAAAAENENDEEAAIGGGGGVKDEKTEFEDITVDVSSTKINAVLRELEISKAKGNTDKTIIVSQFTKLLSIIQPLLEDAGHTYTRLDGSMSQRERTSVIAEFQDPSPDSPRVLLLSLRAGGVGLNLTAANKMVLIDPAWNPATEDQCFDRIHRLGQTRDCQIVKFIHKDSIEERMMAIQEKKKDLISGAFQQTAAERRQQRIQDIRDIFGI